MPKGSRTTSWTMAGNSRVLRLPEWPSPNMLAMGESSGVSKRKAMHLHRSKLRLRRNPKPKRNPHRLPPGPTRRKPASFWCPTRRVCRKVDSVVLPELRQELHCIGSGSPRGLPQPSGQLKLPEKRIMTSKQAPFIGSLPCFVEVTTPLFVSRGDRW